MPGTYIVTVNVINKGLAKSSFVPQYTYNLIADDFSPDIGGTGGIIIFKL